MTCRVCRQYPGTPEVVAAYPDADVSAQRKADQAAAEERGRTSDPVHIHYDPRDDAQVVVRMGGDPR
jgi:hypothetical protein